ncbi:hypothetical protein [Candidatus Palauibacter sp.]|uniref:hypothetical protein n=1 Tax=Candidatus Palauibacter sp. TaxID=3101350 RepID=UPI003AF2CBA5
MSRNRSSLKDGTGLCVPQTPTLRDWLESAVLKYRIKPCGAEGKAEAYLTQAAQSREYPVPLVAGEGALPRVFVMSERETGTMIPPVRATFFVDGAEIHAVDIPAGSSAIPTEVPEGEFDLSANVEIPAEVIQPGPEMVVEAVFDPLLSWNRWWLRKRLNQGLLSYGSHAAANPFDEPALRSVRTAGYESGMDDSPMYEGVPFNPGKNTLELQDVGS